LQDKTRHTRRTRPASGYARWRVGALSSSSQRRPSTRAAPTPLPCPASHRPATRPEWCVHSCSPQHSRCRLSLLSAPASLPARPGLCPGLAMAAPGLALAATLPSHCLVCWLWQRRASYTRTAHRAAGLGSKDLTPRQATNQLTRPPSASRTARRCAAPLCYVHPPSPPLRRRTSRSHALVSGRAPPRTCACGHRGSWQLAAGS
jgi:hypothetical protein